ncbi:MAG TPA: alpha/beta family hydrolase [Vicinamibacterales bacterium]|nr:alpha/beta family hydrolase [Vicinamibacterales bacterium]
MPAALRVYRSERRPAAALILAPGAGAGQDSPFMTDAATALASRGLVVATFDFPYRTAGRKAPDPGRVLEAHWRASIEAATGESSFEALPLFIGGKSMGGRIASQVAAAGDLPIAGLVFLGYPLHPPGKPSQRRDRHLPSIHRRMLFVQGTRDPFGTAAEIRELIPRLDDRTRLLDIEGGDHSFKVPARSGRTYAGVLTGIFDAVVAWITA